MGGVFVPLLHRLKALWDWKTVAELKVGDRIALARQLPEPENPVVWEEHALILLAHLLGDGSYVSQPLRYTTASEANSEAVQRAAEQFGSTVTRQAGRGNWHQLVIAGNGNRWHAQGRTLVEIIGDFWQRSAEKYILAMFSSSPISSWRYLCVICGQPTAALRRIKMAEPGSTSQRLAVALLMMLAPCCWPVLWPEFVTFYRVKVADGIPQMYREASNSSASPG